mmetsp:Transcript_20335/g.52049  ORF Transcript_20335/g.52049 Transcript_20335/m.52049 type:complete len:213 (-) Transcript_20335:55-693(-)
MTFCSSVRVFCISASCSLCFSCCAIVLTSSHCSSTDRMSSQPSSALCRLGSCTAHMRSRKPRSARGSIASGSGVHSRKCSQSRASSRRCSASASFCLWSAYMGASSASSLLSTSPSASRCSFFSRCRSASSASRRSRSSSSIRLRSSSSSRICSSSASRSASSSAGDFFFPFFLGAMVLTGYLQRGALRSAASPPGRLPSDGLGDCQRLRGS